MALAVCLRAVSGCADQMPQPEPAEDFRDPWFDAGTAETPEVPEAPVPEPYSTPFEALLPQPVQWADQTVRVTAARTERGLDARVLDPASSYAVLELDIMNTGNRETDFRARDTWDLRLADGTRIAPANVLDVLIVPGETAHASLVYRVDEGTALTGASMVLEGEVRGQLVPEIIPLDQPHERSQRRLSQLEGMALEPPSGIFASLRIEITSAEFGLNDRHGGRRAETDTRLLSLDVIVTYLTGFGDHGWGTGDARVIIDGRAYEADNFDTDTLGVGTSRPYHLRFVVPSVAERIGVTFRAGYDADAEQHVTVRADVDLTSSESELID